MESDPSTDPASLAAGLAASRGRLDAVTHDLRGERLLGPQLRIVNPPLWELGHVAWFQEFWCLRQRDGTAQRDSILPGADALYDSAKVAHATRWGLPLPSIEATQAYLAEVLGLVTRRLEDRPEDPALCYFAQLAAFHEDMHAEAFHYTRQTLAIRILSRRPIRRPRKPARPGTWRCRAAASCSARGRATALHSTTRSGRTRWPWRHSAWRAPQ